MNESRVARLARRAAGTLAAVLLAAQLMPVERDNPPDQAEIGAPAAIRTVLERSCYDCHSNRTRWPWYAYVAPLSWWVVGHVHDARGDLNMTEWPALDFEQQRYFLGEMKEEIKLHKMPLPSYLWIHHEARLSDEERSTLIYWIDEEVTSLGGF